MNFKKEWRELRSGVRKRMNIRIIIFKKICERRKEMSEDRKTGRKNSRERNEEQSKNRRKYF